MGTLARQHVSACYSGAGMPGKNDYFIPGTGYPPDKEKEAKRKAAKPAILTQDRWDPHTLCPKGFVPPPAARPDLPPHLRSQSMVPAPWIPPPDAYKNGRKVDVGKLITRCLTPDAEKKNVGGVLEDYVD